MSEIFEGYDSSPFAGTDYSFGNGASVIVKEVWVPPTEAVPAVTGTPGPSSVTLLKNKGWNSRARSINPLPRGSYYNFACATGIEGACLGIDIKSRSPNSIKLNNLSHAIVCDIHGVRVMESGEIIVELKSQQVSASNIRIYLSKTGLITYVVTTGTEAIVYTSTKPLTILNPYIYGFLYSAGDIITSSSYKTGTVEYGSV